MTRELTVAYRGQPVAGLRESTRGDQWVLYSSLGKIRHHVTLLDAKPGATPDVVHAQLERGEVPSAPVEAVRFSLGGCFDAGGLLIGATRGRLAGQRTLVDLGVVTIEADAVVVPSQPPKGPARRRASLELAAEDGDGVVTVRAALRPPAAPEPEWLLDAPEEGAPERAFAARDTSGTVELILYVEVSPSASGGRRV